MAHPKGSKLIIHLLSALTLGSVPLAAQRLVETQQPYPAEREWSEPGGAGFAKFLEAVRQKPKRYQIRGGRARVAWSARSRAYPGTPAEAALGFLREHGRGLDDVVPADRQRLLEYRFPGNVRELKNMLLRACALTDLDEQIALAFDNDGEAPPLPANPARAQASAAASLLKLTLPDARRALVDDLDRRYLEAVLDACDGNVSEAAKRAGVARSYLHRLLAKHKGALRRRARW